MSTENLTSGERAYLRGLANKIDPIFQIGKGGINDNFLRQVEEALEARELIKISVLENSEYTAKESAQLLSEGSDSQPVQVIGRKIVLYREAREKDNRKITLPK
jgi:putative RNA-binding protein, YhbY family